MLNKYRSLLLAFVFAILTTSAVSASSIRISTDHSSADGIWIGDDDTDFKNTSGDEGTLTIAKYEIDGTYSLSTIESLIFSVSYDVITMNDIDFASVSADESRRGIGSIGAAYMNHFYSGVVDITAGAGIRAAGDNKSGDNFLGLSDGLTKYDGHLNFSKKFGRISVSFTNMYTFRPEASNQLLNTLGVSGSVIAKKFYLGGSLSMFDTFGGPDIAGPGFDNTNGNGFSRVKEKYTSAYLSATYIRHDMAYDIGISQKLSGENTDIGRSIGFGVTKFY